jgi:hypothetical protein
MRLLEWKPMRSRPTRRPRIRWFDNVYNDVNVMNAKNWKVLALKRKAWNDLVEKAKNHRRF